RHFPAGLGHRTPRIRVLLQRPPDRVDRQRQAVLREDAVNPPETDAAAELGLGGQAPRADDRRSADHLLKVRLRLGVALEDRALAALLVVEDEAEREPSAARP